MHRFSTTQAVFPPTHEVIGEMPIDPRSDCAVLARVRQRAAKAVIRVRACAVRELSTIERRSAASRSA